MSGEPFGPPGTVYISGGAIPVAAIPLAAASRLLQNSRIGLNVARAEVAGQHGKKLSPVAVPVGLYLPFPIPPTIFAPAAFSIAVYAQWLAGTSLNVGAAAKAGTAIVALNAAAMTADKILFFCIFSLYLRHNDRISGSADM